jgi:hypothetical protein
VYSIKLQAGFASELNNTALKASLSAPWMYRKGFKIVSPDLGGVDIIMGVDLSSVAGISRAAGCPFKVRTMDSAFGIKFIREGTKSMS